MLWQLLILCHHYHFFSPACSLFIFYNICSSAHTISLLSKWERAISEHAFPTPWAVTENSRFSFPLSKHTGKFLLLLALRQTSSKQPFPSSMISPPLEQPTESTPPAATQVIGCSQHGQLNYNFTTKPMRSFAKVRASPPPSRALQQHRTSYTKVANWRPCMAPARIPTLLLGGATAKILQFCEAKQD